MVELYVPDNYKLLPSCACGRSGWRGELVPDSILGVSVKAACCIHDYMYTFPRDAGEDYRAHADRVFLNNMLRIIEDKSSWALVRFARRSVAYAYYLAVKNFGGPSFWSDKNPEKNRFSHSLWMEKAHIYGILNDESY